MSFDTLMGRELQAGSGTKTLVQHNGNPVLLQQVCDWRLGLDFCFDFH